jgi:hypothetical protein
MEAVVEVVVEAGEAGEAVAGVVVEAEAEAEAVVVEAAAEPQTQSGPGLPCRW